MEKRFMTKLTHFGTEINMPAASNPKVSPLYMNAAYCFEDAETLEALGKNEIEGYLYERTSNPTNDCLREIMKAIEEGEDFTGIFKRNGRNINGCHDNMSRQEIILLSTK